MGVDVDEARRQDLAVGIDLHGALGADLTDRDDPVALYADVAVEARQAGAVHDPRVAHHQAEFVHLRCLYGVKSRPAGR